MNNQYNNVLNYYVNLRLQLNFDNVKVIKYTSGYFLDIFNTLTLNKSNWQDHEKILFKSLKNILKNIYKKPISESKIISISNNENSIKVKISYQEDKNKKHLEFIYECNSLINILNPLYDDKKMMNILIFFYMIINVDSGHFLSAPPSYYNLFNEDINNKHKLFSNSIECFSGIFNKKIQNYYSLFPEFELGSSGNFFDNFLFDEKYNFYLINPPYTEYIIIKVLEMVKQKKIHEQNILLYLPYWKDIIDPFINLQQNTKHISIKFKIIKKPLVYNHILNKYYTFKNSPIIFIVISDNIKTLDYLFQRCIKKLA